MEQLIRDLYDPKDEDMSDFVIFKKNVLSIADHYLFWLRVLQDHMIFISSRSQKYKAHAESYLEHITQLKLKVPKQSDLKAVTEEIIAIIEVIRDFKRLLLDDLTNHLGEPTVLLPPTFISHMLNELEKFRFLVHHVKINGSLPPVYSLNEHELWLIDIAGHLGAIRDNLDETDKMLRRQAYKQCKIFAKLHAKAVEFICYLKHEVIPENAISGLTALADVETLLYLHFVKEVLELTERKQALGILDSRMLIHMLFEELYYLKNLQIATNLYDPLQACQIKPDPLSMRVVASINASTFTKQ
jgi:hypothetical protein